ncbi:MAG: glycosyltransferase [Gemmatimonadaceae bacterium]|nr:glycosyltransferase [Gemmatimonadaceae bacterium]
MAAGLRVAIVHEWLLTHGGSEEITGQLCRLYPQADLFTLIADPVPSLRELIGDRRVITSFLQRIPTAKRSHRRLLPLMPRAIESLDVSGYDLVISVSHAVAKGVRTAPGQPHLSIVCSPMRYAWDLQEQYLVESGLSSGLKGFLARRLLARMRAWDARTASRPTEIIAISQFIAERIRRVWGRDSTVVYPPVDTGFFTPSATVVREADLYVTASRMVPYKRMPLIVEAFAAMPTRRLVVIGEGPDLARAQAVGAPNVTFLGRVGREGMRDWFRRAAAFVFAAEEDFGIVPVEAMACGTPVIGYGRGGVRETVPDGDCGVLFESQTVEGIRDAVMRFEADASMRGADAACRAQAERFSEAEFLAGVERVVAGMRG